jgi:hypothetical protein
MARYATAIANAAGRATTICKISANDRASGEVDHAAGQIVVFQPAGRNAAIESVRGRVASDNRTGSDNAAISYGNASQHRDARAGGLAFTALRR